MRGIRIVSISGMIIALFLMGCSGSGNPILQTDTPMQKSSYDSMPVIVSDLSDDMILGGMGIMGLFSLHVNPSEMTSEITSLRTVALEDVLEVVDITNFMRLAPCHNCARIQSVSVDADGNLVVTIGIKHPFEDGDPLKPVTGRNRGDLHVFNVEGIVISNSPATTFSGIGQKIAGFQLLNADGYTGYLNAPIDEIFPTDATVHPYVLHFDDYSSGNFDPMNPMGFESVTFPPPSGNLVMAMGSDYDYKNYVFSLGSEDPVDFIYAIGCSYAVSAANKMSRFNPEYRIPQHNKKAASEIRVEIVSNDLAAGNVNSSAILHVEVVDINHGVPVGTALNEMRADSSVGAVTVEVPGVTLSSVNFSTTPIGGTGHDPSDPLIFEGIITNAAGGEMGFYSGLVKVTDNYSPDLNQSPLLNGLDGITRVDPLENPLSGLYAVPEFATYQAFEISIGTGIELTVIIPNGGEVWLAGSDQEIVWDPAGVDGTVFIEYSKDDFFSDINLIVADIDNNGSYFWENIPEDPSTTVKIRVTSTDNPSIKDESDDFFRIKGYRLVFSDEGILPEMIAGYDDISPALCIETDGDIKMAYNVNKVSANDQAYSYACKSSDGLNWHSYQASFQSGGGVLANHGDCTKIVADNQGNSFRTLALYYVAMDAWYTPFAAATEMFPAPVGIDGAHVTTYISRAFEIVMDADEYIYILGDRNNQIQFKKSEVPQYLTRGPSGAVWSSFPIYYIDQGFLSNARSIKLASDDVMYLAYYINDTANQIKLAYNTDSTGLSWDTSTVIYDGASTGTASAKNPGLDITDDGEFHVSFIRESGDNNQICYIYSQDGTDWTDPVVIAEMPVEFTEDPICFFVFDDVDFIAVVWQGGDSIYVSYTYNAGRRWSDATQVDSILDVNKQPDFVVSETGIMHIAWAALNDFHHDIHFRNAWLEDY